jgi:hypothetical protein
MHHYRIEGRREPGRLPWYRLQSILPAKSSSCNQPVVKAGSAWPEARPWGIYPIGLMAVAADNRNSSIHEQFVMGEYSQE